MEMKTKETVAKKCPPLKNKEIINNNMKNIQEGLFKNLPTLHDTLEESNTEFTPLSLDDLANILDLTIKEDSANKKAAFLCLLSAFTETAQFNLSFNAPSSTGKSYIPLEIAQLFPEEDRLELSYCSPTAFFHQAGKYDKKKNEILLDLSRKIIIFLDQPNTQLIGHLRPLLSHDQKECLAQITDKNQKYGTRTKNIRLRGYPVVIFCSASFMIDEQEATRFLLLSPEMSQSKLRKGIETAIHKNTNSAEYERAIAENVKRALLKKRILAIKKLGITDIIVPSKEEITRRFLAKYSTLKPRHQRDIKRILSIVKAIALINPW
jgi:hypothetical protein